MKQKIDFEKAMEVINSGDVQRIESFFGMSFDELYDFFSKERQKLINNR